MASKTTTVNAIVWEFESDFPGLFTPYDDNTSNFIEEQHSKVPQTQTFSLSTADHLLGGYVIDINSMVQTNSRRFFNHCHFF